MTEEYVEKSSTYVHTCPLCGSVHTGTSSLWQHLGSVHQSRLSDVGRWVHCAECNSNFSNDSTWRLHLTKKLSVPCIDEARAQNCQQTSMSIRWREQKRAEERESDEEMDETAFVGLDGRSKPMKDLKKRKKEADNDEPREKRMPILRPYMKPRVGCLIVRQSSNFRCAVCGEPDFPTLPSLVYHMRREHSMQLSQVEHWINCSGCNHQCASLSWFRTHIAAAASTATPPLCSWKTAELSWQTEETSEEARRFLAGMAPFPSSSSAVPGVSSASPAMKTEQISGDELQDASMAGPSTKKRKHNQRVDKSYILARPGHVIVRRQQNLVCQLCFEGGFVTCSSIDFHMRKVHKAGVHQAGMWLHCARCLQDFCNISSVRTHVAVEVNGECCGWENIFMCWHEKQNKEANVIPEMLGVQMGGPVDDRPDTSFVVSIQESNATPMPKRYRKLFKPPSQAEDGFTIVKRNVDLPCFGCTSRCPSLTTFIWHMQGKHRLYFSDIGAWMECSCGREFTSTTALRVHLREDGVESHCSMNGVSLCWQQRLGGRETETPCYLGAPENAPSTQHFGKEEPFRDDDIYDPALEAMASEVLKHEMHEVKVEEIDDGGPMHPQSLNALITPNLMEGWEAANMGATKHTGHDTTGSNLFDPAFDKLTSGVVKEEEEEGDPLNGKEEEDMNEAGRSEHEDTQEETGEDGNSGRRLATFDPTGYEDGDRFVLRKTALMACRSCGVLRATPNELAEHLQMAHEEEMRGLRRDWQEQQWLECASCHSVFHAATDHEQHLLQAAQACSMADARLCWMEKVERENGK